MKVDHRPQLERTATKALRACALLVLASAALGAGLASAAVVRLTKAQEARVAP